MTLDDNDSSEKTGRFVILRHDVGQYTPRTTKSHWDWMFELEGRLRTFAVDAVDWSTFPIESPADSLADHRIAYLDYEGELSHDRGSVQRIAWGRYKRLQVNDKRFLATLVQIQWATATINIENDQRILVDFSLVESLETWRLRLSPA